ncbi:TetR/AcrR family transcriptional regulator [Streptomyces pinistramenti]|uniref:TetR/AcrR family transcriptional regulator n=1 Tax=Streptomyces pinistramenti TaxID=2884812 RepID=UPI001D06C9A3|nr:TetR/AcrR family transcriptional regulator C-terminal domain-containing protein [Streptomyces pinistramenti]MCB5907179.1 TetR/AcrR family transcriptional regulator C-terminal domain-containing protein [Streptomyces pinistramenti]
MARPRTPLLNRARIGETALRLVDEQGDFSVPQIARALGVQTASVYHHVDGRTGVIELLRERINDSIDASTLDGAPWDAALEAWARSYRAAFAAHPRAIPLLAVSPVRAPKVLALYERASGLLLDAGFAPSDVIPVIVALENVVLGSALDLAAPEAMWDVADADRTPRLAQALAATGPGRAGLAFELSLAGVMARVREVQAGGGSGLRRS